MRMTLRPMLGAMAAAALALAASAPAYAQSDQSGVRVGLLTCNEASGWGLVFGSSHRIHCTLANTDGHQVARYKGTIDKFGVDVGYQSGGVLVWGVIAPTNGPKPGSLNGHYAGVTAGAAVGVGASANLLVGGLDRSISLQPLSVEGMTGVNLAAGIGGMTLEWVPN